MPPLRSGNISLLKLSSYEAVHTAFKHVTENLVKDIIEPKGVDITVQHGCDFFFQEK